MLTKSEKEFLAHLILQEKSIVLSPVSLSNSKRDKLAAWTRIYSQMVSIGARVDSPREIRDTLWQNMRKSTLHRLEMIREQKGSGELKSIDKVVVEILDGRESSPKNGAMATRSRRASRALKVESMDNVDMVDEEEEEEENVEEKGYEILNDYDDDDEMDRSGCHNGFSGKVRAGDESDKWDMEENLLLKEKLELIRAQTQLALSQKRHLEEMSKLEQSYKRLENERLRLEVLKLQRELGIKPNGDNETLKCT